MPPAEDGRPLLAPDYEGLTLLLPAAMAAKLEQAAHPRGQSSPELNARIVRDFLHQQAAPRPRAQG
jgi:hypothetical protein